MNQLIAAHSLLGQAMIAHPRLLLANAVTWLDPLHPQGRVEHLDADALDEFGTDDFVDALDICRDVFPDVYGDISPLLCQGIHHTVLEQRVLDGINRHLVMKMGTLEEIHYGVPVEAMGVSLYYTDDFFEVYPDLADILADFGINQDSRDEDIPQSSDIARRLYLSLEKQPGIVCENICYLISWLFAFSRNTCVDFTFEEYWDSGITPLEWSSENIAFMNEIALEAISIIEAAQSGLKTLQADQELRLAFRRNIQTLYATPEAVQKEERKKADVHLRWPRRA